jgi:ribokinase
MNKRPRIVVIGSLVFDFVARAPRLPRSGETLLGDMFGMFPGGKGANQAVQAGRLGADVHMIGRVGDDMLGERLIASLQESGVVTDLVRRDPRVKTAACCIHVDSQGNNSIIIVPEANAACSPDDIDAARDLIGSADAVLLQLEIPIPTVARAVQTGAELGVRVILNPAPAQTLASTLLAGVAILTPNEHEAEQLTGSAQPEHAAARLMESGVKTVIVTIGERGSYLATSRTSTLIPSYTVSAVDTTAAGDAFNGALAVALGEGRPMEDAIRFANAAGALACTRVGAQPSLAWRQDVESLYLAGQEHRA